MKKNFFAGANTVNGFVSYYDKVFGECEKIYIIKGGSGTGKSSLMKTVAAAAESKGREVEYFYCSFDPASLDGIIIDGIIAIIDGTAPHVYEPTLPGAKENLVDLGAFWDEAILRARGEEIKELLAAKKQCFKSAYAYLSAVGAMDHIKRNIVDKYIIRDNIAANAADLLSELKPPKKGKSGIRLVSSLGMKGRVKFDTFENIAPKTLTLYDSLGVGYLYLEALKKEAERLGIPTNISYDPLFENRPDALLLGDSVAVVLSSDSGDERFSAYEDLLHEKEKNELAELGTQSKYFESNAVEHLKKASEIHFGIENIFISAMDFERKEAFSRDFIRKHI